MAATDSVALLLFLYRYEGRKIKLLLPYSKCTLFGNAILGSVTWKWQIKPDSTHWTLRNIVSIQSDIINDPAARLRTAQSFVSYSVWLSVFPPVLQSVFRFIFFFVWLGEGEERNRTQQSAEKKQYFSALVNVSLHSSSCFTKWISNAPDKQMSLRCFFAVARRHPEGSEQPPAPPPLAELLQDNAANLAACWCYLTAVIKPPAVVRGAKHLIRTKNSREWTKHLSVRLPGWMPAYIMRRAGKSMRVSDLEVERTRTWLLDRQGQLLQEMQDRTQLSAAAFWLQ